MTSSDPSAGLSHFNALPPEEAQAALLKCCGSRQWATAMLRNRPFATPAALLDAADRHWRGLSRADWLEAFSHHPRIGEKRLDQARFAATREQSTREQSGMAAATGEIRAEFERLNAEYERKFGHVFLICATGKSAEFMLAEIRRRIELTHDQELHNAADQQAQIMTLRLNRMLSP